MSANTTSFGNSIQYMWSPAVTVTKSGGIVKARFIKTDGSDYAGASDLTCGVSLSATSTTSNQEVETQIAGIALVEAGAAFAAGNRVECDSSGRVVTLASGISRGKALDAAGASGDIVRVLLTPGA